MKCLNHYVISRTMPPPSSTFSIAPGPLVKQFDAACARLDSRPFLIGALDPPTRSLDCRPEDPTTHRQPARLAAGARLRHAARPPAARVRRFGRAKRVHRRRAARHGWLEPRAGSPTSGALPRRSSCPAFCARFSGSRRSTRRNGSRARHALRPGQQVGVDHRTERHGRRGRAARDRRRACPLGHAVRCDHGPGHGPTPSCHRRRLSRRIRQPADIGGRYSALSLFGMVPAALMGLDLDELLAAPAPWSRPAGSTNRARIPGLALGALMGAAAPRPRQADALGPAAAAVVWALGRATGGREHRQTGKGRRAR